MFKYSFNLFTSKYTSLGLHYWKSFEMGFEFSNKNCMAGINAQFYNLNK